MLKAWIRIHSPKRRRVPPMQLVAHASKLGQPVSRGDQFAQETR